MDTLSLTVYYCYPLMKNYDDPFMSLSCQNRRTVVAEFTYVELVVSIMSSFSNCFICVRTGGLKANGSGLDM